MQGKRVMILGMARSGVAAAKLLSEKGAFVRINDLKTREQLGKALDGLAKKHRIPVQPEVMGRSTGTNADVISKENAGIPTALLSIPQRYLHTPVDTVDVRDVAAVGELMAAYLTEGGEQA